MNNYRFYKAFYFTKKFQGFGIIVDCLLPQAVHKSIFIFKIRLFFWGGWIALDKIT
jgi:hypothetical protein